MELWWRGRDILGADCYEYRYEDLIDDFEGTLRGVLDFLELPWSDDVRDYQNATQDSLISTPSYLAVREKLNRRAVGRWKNYEAHMGDALDILAEDVKRLGYDH